VEEEKICTDTLTVNIGPQHPATHGVFRAQIELDGEVVIGCTPILGYLHRGIEKLAENLTYPQFIPYLDRLDYLAGFLNEYPFVAAVEKLMGIEVPERASYLRVLMMELNRIAAHLVNVGAQGLDLASMTPMVYTMREREYLLELFAAVAGSRMTFNWMRFGGVKNDIPEGFLARVDNFIHYLKDRMPEYAAMLQKNEIFMARTKGIGILSAEDAINFGCSGPVLRGSGIARDIRMDESYEIYNKLEFKVISKKNGDSYDRYMVRFDEIWQSIHIIEQILARLPEGEIRAKVPKIIKPPAGEVYARVEAPIGELGIYLVSDGTAKPWKVKIRAPSFSNLMMLPTVINGLSIPDVIATLASIAPTMGEADR